MVFQLTEMLEVTDLAADKAKTLLVDKGFAEGALRVFVVGGGCSGYQYGMALANDAEDGDTVIEKKRRAVPGGPGERAADLGLAGGLHRRRDEAGLQHLEPEREPQLRLRLLVRHGRPGRCRPGPLLRLARKARRPRWSARPPRNAPRGERP